MVNFASSAHATIRSPEEMCVEIEPDGLTLCVNENRSDLLLDSEVRRFAEPVTFPGADERPRYQMTLATLAMGRRQGVDARGLDGWFRRRTGQPLPSAARLLLTGDETPPLSLHRMLVLRIPTGDVADGLTTWAETRGLIAERLSMTVLAVAPMRLTYFGQNSPKSACGWTAEFLGLPPR